MRAVCLLTKHKQSTTAYWQEWNRLHHQLPNKLHLLLEAVSEAINNLVRAILTYYGSSSTIELLSGVVIPNELARVQPS